MKMLNPPFQLSEDRLKEIYKVFEGIQGVQFLNYGHKNVNEDVVSIVESTIGDKTFEKVKKLLDDKENIFITGGGGVGKSYLLNQIKEIIPSMSITSTTGISALNVGGQTIHSWAGIGLGKYPLDYVIKNMKTPKRNLILKTEVLAIDEVSMLDSYTLEYVNAVLKSIRLSTKPFGGIQVIFIGDFFQLPPVSLGQKTGNGLSDFCFTSSVWKQLNLKVVNLTHVYRQQDKQLINALNHIRMGGITEDDAQMFNSRNDVTPDDNVVRLYPTNNQVNSYNMEKFLSLPTEIITFFSTDTLISYKKGKPIEKDVFKEDSNLTTSEKSIWDSFNRDCRAAYRIDLREGCRVMLLSNVDIKKGLVNGSCGTVVNLSSRNIKVKFDNGIIQNIDKVVFEGYHDGKLRIKRKQYPLMLSYACSIHKSQGMTLDSAYIDFKGIFTFGQAYVALSRVKTLDGLYLSNFNPNLIQANPKVIEYYKTIDNIKEC